MANWGVITWIGILMLVLVLLIYYKGAVALGGNLASGLGTTARTLTGQNSLGTGPVGYAPTV